MTASVLPLPQAPTIPLALKKKRVLLVDSSAAAKRDLRADTMRKLGIDVDCAADIIEARSWWRADLYNLVLIHTQSERGHREKFCEDVRSATPPQQLAFLVGKPAYLADSPEADIATVDVAVIVQATKPAIPADALAKAQRWGILEASQQISAVRTKSHARSKTVREKPEPPRDLETRFAKQNAAWSQVLPELQKEDLG